MLFMDRGLLASLLVVGCGALACNAAPKNTCNPYAHAIASAGVSAPSCNGVCESIVFVIDGGPEGGTPLDVCIVDCTDGGNAACSASTTCVSAAPIRPSSYCLPTCGTDDAGNDAGSCPSPWTCSDAGVGIGVCL